MIKYIDNKNKITLLIFLGISIIINVIIVIILFPNIFSFSPEASAVAIIGGADGPTTIYNSKI
jgi:Na+-transporting methylmalonyl-CoA/oxaloacetate decarboxylase beta subunit